MASFDMDAARTLADWSAAAYAKASLRPVGAAGDVREILHAVGDRTVFRAVVGESGIGTIAAFRGTVPATKADWALSVINWTVNLDAELRPAFGGRVHSGFLRTAELFLAEMIALLADCRGPIRLAGHSLGGALAQVMAPMLAMRGYPVADVHVFGAPRVGDAAFADSLNIAIHRVEHADDVVPHIPPEEDVLDGVAARSGMVSTFLQKRPYLRGFRHAGRLTFIDWGGIVHVELSQEREREVRRERLHRLAVSPVVAGPGKAFSDHLLDRYIRGLKSPLAVRRR